MKFTVTLKDPDGIYDSIDEAAKEEAKRIEETVGGFFEYGDYVHIEVDTDAGTAILVKK